MSNLTILILIIFLNFQSSFSQSIKTLKDVQLKGCILIEDPYVIEDPTSSYGFSGIAITYLDQLRDTLGFDIQLNIWNQSWSSFINVMSNCSNLPQSNLSTCPCHIGVGSFTMTNNRTQKIRFIWPFSNEAHHMISKKSDLRVDDSEDRWFVFKTFDFKVWLIIFFGMILHAIGTIFFGPFKPKSKHIQRQLTNRNQTNRNLSRKTIAKVHAKWQLKRFPAAIVYAYSHLIGHPIGPELGTPSIHRASWNVLGLTAGIFLLAVYEASLTVLLFESTKESPFKSIRDITNCALNPTKIAVIQGGASQAFWNSAINNSYITRKCGWDDVGIPVSNIRHGFHLVRTGQADYFFSLEGSVTITANRNCSDIVSVGESFFSTSVGFVMSKHDNQTLSDILSETTRILREQDSYETAQSIAARSSCDAVVDARITAPKLGVFFILYVVVWISLLVYRGIFLYKRRRAIQETENDNDHHNVNLDINAMDLAIPTQISNGSSYNSFSNYLEGYPYPR